MNNRNKPENHTNIQKNSSIVLFHCFSSILSDFQNVIIPDPRDTCNNKLDHREEALTQRQLENLFPSAEI